MPPVQSGIGYRITVKGRHTLSPRKPPDLPVSARAGIVVTGTEVLTGRVVDRNGPWLADRLLELGVELAHNVIVGDRPADVEAALGWLASHGVDLIVTSGGLGPTEDDLTAEVVGRFQGREMVLDEAMEEKIAAILRPLAARWPDLDMEAVRAANRKQAVVPRGATVLDPVGTAPGLVVPPGTGSGPTDRRAARPAARAAADVAGGCRHRRVPRRRSRAPCTTRPRCCGCSGSRSRRSPRRCGARARTGVDIDALEITTCLRRGEVEVVTRYEPEQAALYSRVRGHRARAPRRHAVLRRRAQRRRAGRGAAARPRLADRDGRVVHRRAAGARITDRAGRVELLPGRRGRLRPRRQGGARACPPATLDAHGEVSVQTALRARRARARAPGSRRSAWGSPASPGPDGGTAEKPVGLVCFSVAGPDGSLTRSANLPGGRFDVRDRSTTVALHMVRRLLLGEHDTE